MSEETERGESYLEIQMDRWTIAIAALAFVGLLIGAFLLGGWWATRSDAGEAPAQAQADEPPEEADHDATEPVGVESSFGPGSVSARNAPQLTQVPPPVATETVVEEPVRPAATAARPSAPARAPAPRATAPTRASAPAAATAAMAGGSWVVQVAALEKEAEAEALKTRLAGKGHPMRVLRDGGWFKVQAGPYANKSDARLAEERLKREERLTTWLKPA